MTSTMVEVARNKVADDAMNQLWREWLAFYKERLGAFTGIGLTMADQRAFYEIAQPIMRRLASERDTSRQVNKAISERGVWKDGQWPRDICSGFISYQPSEYGGYVFRDASHGIPVLGHVVARYHGSYPEQAEKIARRLVVCWNASVGRTIEDLEAEASAKIGGEKHGQ